MKNVFRIVIITVFLGIIESDSSAMSGKAPDEKNISNTSTTILSYKNYIGKDIIVTQKASAIHVDKDNNLYIMNGGDKEYFKYENKDNQYKNPKVYKYSDCPEGKAPKIEKYVNEYIYEIYRSEFDKTGIKIKRVAGKLLADIKAKEIGFDPAYVSYLGVDGQGNGYFLLDTTFVGVADPNQPETWKLEVYKYSKEGEFLSKIALDSDYASEIERRYGQKDNVKIDKEGNIYQFIYKKDKYQHIIKYIQKGQK